MDMKTQLNIILLLALLSFQACEAQDLVDQTSEGAYDYKQGSPYGIGKWYKGREIAHVMGYQGINWLEREEREQEEETAQLIANMDIQSENVIADIGAGSGYHVFKMAPLAIEGLVYAVDIQPEMLEAIEEKNEVEGLNNIRLIEGSEKAVNLPKNSIDKVLMVDVYHEFSYPQEMLESIHQALKSDGKVFLIEYRKEEPHIPIKEIHKMTEVQAIKEFEANGFELIENINNLPWQHCMVFGKAK
jgi:SAM-dependent methyltransferase